MKAYGGNECIDPYFLELGTSWRLSGQLQAPFALPPRKEHLYSLDRKLGGHQSRSGCGEEKTFLTLLVLELRPLGRQAHSQFFFHILILSTDIGRIISFSLEPDGCVST
jgi:hypothetical protein